VSVLTPKEMLSNFTKTIQVGKTGALFIIDSQGILIASKDFSQIVSKKGKKASLTKISSVNNNRHLRIIHNSIQNNKVNLYDFKDLKQFEYYDEFKDERYHIILKKIKNRDLIIATILPEKDFLGEIQQNTKNLFFLLIAIITFSLMLGSHIVQKFIVTPILKLLQIQDIFNL